MPVAYIDNTRPLGCKTLFLEPMKRGLNPKDYPYISKMERVMAIFVGQGMTISLNLKIFKSQYLSEFLRYGPDFLHVCTYCYNE